MREVDTIKEALINTCITGDFKYFKAYYFSDNVVIETVDKKKYSKFFKKMLRSAFEESVTNLIFDFNDEDGEEELCFYDNIHKHPRLTVYITELNSHSLALDVLPF